MFKNGISLNQKAWYCKLLKYMWGTKVIDYNNFCPLFWLILGSITILPIYLILRPIVKIYGYEIKIKENKIISLGIIVNNLMKFLITGFLGFVVSIILIGFIQLIINDYFMGSWYHLLGVFWIIVAVILVIIIIFILINVSIKIECKKDDKKKLRNTNTLKNKIRKVWKEFYNNNCPLIKWK